MHKITLKLVEVVRTNITSNQRMEIEVHGEANRSIRSYTDASIIIFVVRFPYGQTTIGRVREAATISEAEGSVSLGKSAADQREGNQANNGSHLNEFKISAILLLLHTECN